MKKVWNIWKSVRKYEKYEKYENKYEEYEKVRKYPQRIGLEHPGRADGHAGSTTTVANEFEEPVKLEQKKPYKRGEGMGGVPVGGGGWKVGKV